MQVEDADKLEAGAPMAVTVNLDRDDDDGVQQGPVIAPFYPTRKEEGWWLVVGDPQTNKCVPRVFFFSPRGFSPRGFSVCLTCHVLPRCTFSVAAS